MGLLSENKYKQCFFLLNQNEKCLQYKIVNFFLEDLIKIWNLSNFIYDLVLRHFKHLMSS